MSPHGGGVVNNGGYAVYNGDVAGGDIVKTAGRAAAGGGRDSRAEVGVLTVLPVEMRAVVAALRQMYDYGDRRLAHGPLAHEAWLPDSRGRRVRVAAVQALRPGTESAALAFRGLVDEYRPVTVLLVGIAGGVAPQVGIGDVVLSDQMIAYDGRKEAADGVRRRGQAQAVAAALGHRINDFLTATPAVQQRGNGESFRLHHGPIGSGNAVVADAGSEIQRWLTEVNEKVLAVETESAGVAQSFHESTDGAGGWLTVRGISDAADRHKNDDAHELAARRAAEVMAMLLPFLHPGP
jgi:adenosylhomocysteine nucleosidase